MELYHSLCTHIAELSLLLCLDSVHWANGQENFGIELFVGFKLLFISFSLNVERSAHSLVST